MRRTIHYLPLEHVEHRYTAHLDASILDYLHESGATYARYYPETRGRAERRPARGRFLNSTGTIEFKAKQIAELAEAWHDGYVRDGDIVFCSDLWHPGIEAVGYLSHFTGVRVKLRGILHAGSYTETDWTAAFGWWASHFETAVLAQADEVFVGSSYHARDLTEKRLAQNVVRTPLPLDPKLRERAEHASLPGARLPLVVFSGRNSPEKQPWEWGALKQALCDWRSHTGNPARFVWTDEEDLDRDDYYSLLASASCVVSFAVAEYFGYGIQEAVALGCVPVVPDRLCYPEQFSQRYRYRTWEGCLLRVRAALDGTLDAPKVPDNAASVARWFA